MTINELVRAKALYFSARPRIQRRDRRPGEAAVGLLVQRDGDDAIALCSVEGVEPSIGVQLRRIE